MPAAPPRYCSCDRVGCGNVSKTWPPALLPTVQGFALQAMGLLPELFSNCGLLLLSWLLPVLEWLHFGSAVFWPGPFSFLLCNGSVCHISLATSFSTCGSALSSNASPRSVVRGIAAGVDASPPAPAVECLRRGVVPVLGSWIPFLVAFVTTLCGAGRCFDVSIYCFACGVGTCRFFSPAGGAAVLMLQIPQ